MAITTSLRRRLSTIFSIRPRSSPRAAAAPEGTAEVIPTKRLSLRILLLLIFAVALSPVLVIGGVRWSGDIERETQRRRETMLLVAEQSAGRAQLTLARRLTSSTWSTPWSMATYAGPTRCRSRSTFSRNSPPWAWSAPTASSVAPPPKARKGDQCQRPRLVSRAPQHRRRRRPVRRRLRQRSRSSG